MTKGEPAVYAETVYDETKFYAVVGALEQSSLHPLAKAVMKHLEIKNPQCMFNEPQQITVLPGEGIRAEVGGKLFWVGSEEVLKHVNGQQDHIRAVEDDIRRMKAQGYTIVAAVSEDRIRPVRPCRRDQTGDGNRRPQASRGRYHGYGHADRRP